MLWACCHNTDCFFNCVEFASNILQVEEDIAQAVEMTVSKLKLVIDLPLDRLRAIQTENEHVFSEGLLFEKYFVN